MRHQGLFNPAHSENYVAEGYARHSVTIIVDLIHVSEYLWKAALALCGDSRRKAEEWMQERLLRILRGEASQVFTDGGPR